MFEAALEGFGKLYDQFGPTLTTGMLLLGRVITFFFLAPVFNRKDIIFNVKLALALFITAALVWVVPAHTVPSGIPGTAQFFYWLLLNMFVGGLIGLTADMIHRVISAAGAVMNNQIGLSSAMIFDPSSRGQVMLLDQFFGLFATVLFVHMNGHHWLLNALRHSLRVFPVYAQSVPFTTAINLEYLVTISANALTVAVQLVAPVVVITLAVDIILGVVNRAAQQIPVFQLSAALKPAIGIGVFLATLPQFVAATVHYLQDYERVFPGK
jgi:flagellar biosynthetic protein FliR